MQNGIVKDITEYVEGSDTIDLDNIWEYGVDSYRYDGKRVGEGAIYALPKDVGPFSFGYNKTMLEKAGIPLPDKDKPYTFDEFVAAAKKLTADTNGDGALDQWGTGLNVQWNLQPFVWSNGGDWLNEDRTKVTVDTPEFAESLQWFADLQNVHGVTPVRGRSPDPGHLPALDEGRNRLLPHRPLGPLHLPEARLRLGRHPLPGRRDRQDAPPGSARSASPSPKAPSTPEDAVKLVEYLTANKEAQQSLVDAGIQIPNLKDMAETWAADTTTKPANKAEFLEIVKDYGRALPGGNTYNAEWYDELFTNIQPVLDGKQTAADYLKEAQPRMQEFLDAANQQAGN